MENFFMFSDDGFEFYKTEREAIAAAENELMEYRASARHDNEWSEETDRICYGRVTGRVRVIDLGEYEDRELETTPDLPPDLTTLRARVAELEAELEALKEDPTDEQ